MSSERAPLTHKPPGPRGLPLLGSLTSALTDVLALWIDMNRNYGPVSYARMAWFDLYMLNEPELITQFMVGHFRDSFKDLSALPEATQFMGLGVATLEGDAWRVRRKLASPAFQPKRIAGYVDSMVEYAERAATSYKQGEARDFHRDSMSLTLAIAAKTLLGFEMGHESQRIEAIMDLALGYFTKRMFRLSQRLIPAAVPTGDQRRFQSAIKEIDGMIYAMLARCRTESSASDHLLAHLLRARDDNGEGLSDQQLRDEAVGMLVAGYETTALTLTYAVYELSRHPAVAEKVRAEVERVAPGRRLNTADLPNLVWTEAVVKEALRLYPPSHAVSRKVFTPFELGGYVMPKGCLVSFSIYAMQRNPRWFPEPDRFRPERWFEGADKLPRGAYLPFGEGPRTCVGSHFAMVESKIVLATLLRHVELTVAKDYKLQLDAGISLRPIGGMPVSVQLRSAKAAAGESTAVVV
jgi:cytochrome P450